MKAQVKIELEMRDGYAEVTTRVDMGEELEQVFGPYLLVETDDVDALVKHAVQQVRAAGLTFLAKTGAEVCEERIE